MNVTYEETKKTIMHGQNAVVCTIIKSEGSSPRKAGSSMVVNRDGKSWGSVGGGEIENYCIRKAVEVHRTGESFVQEFHLDSSRQDAVSMICGGDVTVQFTFIDYQHTDPEDLDRMFGIERVLPVVYIFGGGHVGTELVPVLEHLGFRVVLMDDREEFAASKRHPKAERTICGDFSDISRYVTITADDYVVIMTHGHIADRTVLLQAMKTRATYIGCIGSRRKVEATNRFLMENGIPESELGRIHSPIGIELFGDTPEEIAISVAAELIRHRALLSRE